MAPRWWIAIMSFFVVAGLVTMGVGFNELAKAYESESWPPAAGVIMSSDVKSNPGDDGQPPTYSAEICYQYVVDGEKLSGTLIKFGDVSTNNSFILQREVNDCVEKYYAGKTVKVYYNKEAPHEAVLEPGVHDSTLYTAWVGFYMVLFCIGIFVIGRNPLGIIAWFRSATGASQEEISK
jgi:hypothetical protein